MRRPLKMTPLFLCLALGAMACGEPETSPDSPSPDAENAAFSTLQGKADSILAQCDPVAMLGWLNEPSQGEDALKESGVHTRAARNIVKFRAGADGELGTGDDQNIQDMQQLDDISWVGPVALEQLAAGAESSGRCELGASYEVIFSPQPFNDSHLTRAAQLIDGAEHSLDIAMYSYRDSGIQRAIQSAIARGVKVRMIFEKANEDRKNPEGSASAKLEELGVDVRYINKIMHHKFMMVDGPRDFVSRAHTARLMSGSANWSSSAATRYDENTVFMQGSAELALRYQREFNHLWKNSRDFVEEGMASEPELSTLEITDELLPEEPNVTAVFTSANFKTSVSSRFGNTFSRVRGRDEVSDYLVSQIESASSSIKVASGHLRSRPVAEALMAKHKDSPEVDIKVFLDGQEYVSSFYAAQQERDLETCLEKAGDSSPRQEDCIDKGFYYGIKLHEAGLDVRYKYYSYRWHYKTAPQMHHKYMVIDGETVIQGSYNLSDNAEHNTMENMATFSGPAAKSLAAAYDANFESMWQTGQQEQLFGQLVGEIEQADSEIPIIFDAMSLDWEQVTQLKGLIRERCPAINSKELRENPEKHFTCKL